MRHRSSRFLFLLALFTLYPSLGNANINAGFVNGVWYSKNTFFADETIRIYAAIQNRAGFDIIGKVNFYDDDKVIGEFNFNAASGRLIEAWIDWKATKGEHSIYTKVFDTKKSEPGKTPEIINLESTISQKSNIFTDLDTDHDKIGNLIDTDDDNDKILDTVEIALNTDPLIPNVKTIPLATETKSDNINKKETLTENIVAQIVSGGKGVIPIIDNVITQYLKATEKAKEGIQVEISKTKIDSEKTEKVSEKVTSPKEKGLKFSSNLSLIWLYLKLATLLAISYFLTHKILLYIIFLLILFFILRSVLKRIF